MFKLQKVYNWLLFLAVTLAILLHGHSAFAGIKFCLSISGWHVKNSSTKTITYTLPKITSPGQIRVTTYTANSDSTLVLSLNPGDTFSLLPNETAQVIPTITTEPTPWQDTELTTNSEDTDTIDLSSAASTTRTEVNGNSTVSSKEYIDALTAQAEAITQQIKALEEQIRSRQIKEEEEKKRKEEILALKKQQAQYCERMAQIKEEIRTLEHLIHQQLCSEQQLIAELAEIRQHATRIKTKEDFIAACIEGFDKTLERKREELASKYSTLLARAHDIETVSATENLQALNATRIAREDVEARIGTTRDTIGSLRNQVAVLASALRTLPLPPPLPVVTTTMLNQDLRELLEQGGRDRQFLLADLEKRIEPDTKK